MRSGVLVIALVLGPGCASPSRSPSSSRDSDEYRNFAELSAHQKEGSDYRILRHATGSTSLVMAIHGGGIEPGTTELAEEIAADDLGLYSFVAMGSDPGKMHLTSTHYDEPGLLSLIAESDRCLSLHGYQGEQAAFCVGGGDSSGRSSVLGRLERAFPDLRGCEQCCPPNSGNSGENVVNRCRRPGVQVELSPSTRERILGDGAFRERVAKALRGWLVR